MIVRQALNKFGPIDGYYIIYDGAIQVADVHGTLPFPDDDGDDQYLSDEKIRGYADLMASAPELKQRAEAAEARAAQLEAERDELRRQLEQARNREQMDRAVMTEASAKIDDLRRQLEQAHAIIAEQSNTVMDLTL